ncbi:Multifunctional Methyltransferase [Sphaerulina musiva]
MKLLTLNFLTCARKTCKSSPAAFPLHPQEAELEQIELDLNPLFIKNILPRLDWTAMKTVANELGLPNLPAEVPEAEALMVMSGGGEEQEEGEPTQVLKDLHLLFMETSIRSGKLVCGNCGHEYAIKEGIANFLLPSHMV